MTFAEKLKEMRTAAGLSQKELARAARMPMRTIQAFEIGRRLPGWLSILKLARGLAGLRGNTLAVFDGCDVRDEIKRRSETPQQKLRRKYRAEKAAIEVPQPEAAPTA